MKVQMKDARRKAAAIEVCRLGMKKDKLLDERLQKMSVWSRRIIQAHAVEGKVFPYIARDYGRSETTVQRRWADALEEYADKYMEG